MSFMLAAWLPCGCSVMRVNWPQLSAPPSSGGRPTAVPRGTARARSRLTGAGVQVPSSRLTQSCTSKVQEPPHAERTMCLVATGIPPSMNHERCSAGGGGHGGRRRRACGEHQGSHREKITTGRAHGSPPSLARKLVQQRRQQGVCQYGRGGADARAATVLRLISGVRVGLPSLRAARGSDEGVSEP